MLARFTVLDKHMQRAFTHTSRERQQFAAIISHLIISQFLQVVNGNQERIHIRTVIFIDSLTNRNRHHSPIRLKSTVEISLVILLLCGKKGKHHQLTARQREVTPGRQETLVQEVLIDELCIFVATEDNINPVVLLQAVAIIH